MVKEHKRRDGEEASLVRRVVQAEWTEGDDGTLRQAEKTARLSIVTVCSDAP